MNGNDQIPTAAPPENNNLTEALWEEYEDSLFRLAMQELAQREGDHIVASLKDYPAKPSAESVKKFQKRMDQEIRCMRNEQIQAEKLARAQRRAAKRANMSHTTRITRKLLMVAALVAAAAVTLTFSVSAFREPVFEFFSGGNSGEEKTIGVTQFPDQYRTYGMESEAGSATGMSEQDALVGYEGHYKFGSVPDNYTFSRYVNQSLYKSILYENSDNQEFYLAEYPANSGNTGVTLTDGKEEDTVLDTKPVLVHGNKATWSEGNDYVGIAWQQGDYLLYICSTDKKLDLVALAEKVEEI